MRFRRRRSEAAKKPRRRIRKLRLLALMLVLLVLAACSFTFGLVTAIAGEIPKLDPARQKTKVNGVIYDSTGDRVLAILRGSENRVLVSDDQIADVMKHAIVAIEDRRFFEHRGVDLRAISRALWADVQEKEAAQGGSTITQQYIKNAYVKKQRSIGRKLREAALAWQLEQQWSKKKILTSYLNTIYFGNGAYGIQQAAVSYFDHGAAKLTLPEAALLAGIPSDPSRYDPVTNPRAARAQRDLVLRLMLEQGRITRREYRRATRTRLPRPQDVRLPGTQGPAGQYFVNYVKQQLVDEYRAGKVFGGGLRVRTTIDLRLQKLGHKAIAKWLSDDEGPAAALVAIDPRDGSVRALIGGRNFRESQFNLAVQGERQAGSAFKPVVLAAALDQGISPATRFVSEPTVISLGDKLWSVSNYEDTYLGSIDLESATIHSDNAVYAQLTQLVGPRNVVRMAKALGVKSRLNSYFAIGLGAEAVNPLELARAFSTFATGGQRIDGSVFGDRPRAVVSVEKTLDDEIDRNDPVPRQVLDPDRAAIVNSLLQKVVTQGTGRRAALPDRPAAGKTGTTENYGDAWFVGYTPQLAVAVWVGYPHRLIPMLTEFSGDPVAGGTFPALIWKSFMEKALPYLGLEPEYFPPASVPYASPKTVVVRNGRLMLDNGVCRGTKQVFYFEEEGPTNTADCKPNEVEVPRVVGSTLAAARERLAAQPLSFDVVYKPAAPGQRVDVVLGQIPARGTLSAYEEVTLILARSSHGVVPRVVGLSLERARAKLARLRLQPKLIGNGSRVVSQVPRKGVAAAPGMSITLVLARG